MPRLVGGDGPAFRLGVLDGLCEPDLLGHLGVLQVVPRELAGAATERPDERLVHQVLDHDRRVPRGQSRQGLPLRRVVELGTMGLLAEVVVDDVQPSRPAGETEVDAPVEPTGSEQRRVEIGGPVGRADHQDVGGCDDRPVELPMARQPGVDQVDQRRLHPHRRWRLLLEGLQLHQQFVDHSRDALAVVGAGPSHPADRVELLDETDRTTLAPRVFPQRPEERADLPVGLSVEHRLERGRGDEEERHARFGRHGLRHVGLAGTGRTLEEDRLPGHSTHLLREDPVCEEEVEGLRDLFDEDLRAPHVVEAHGELVGPVEDVR